MAARPRAVPNVLAGVHDQVLDGSLRVIFRHPPATSRSPTTIWLGQRFRALLADIFDHGKLSDDFRSTCNGRRRPTPVSRRPAAIASCPLPGAQFTDRHRRRRGKSCAIARGGAFADHPAGFGKLHHRRVLDGPDRFPRRLSGAPRWLLDRANFQPVGLVPLSQPRPAYRQPYFVGAGTHPGAGLPGVVSSAKVVETLPANGRPRRLDKRGIGDGRRLSVKGLPAEDAADRRLPPTASRFTGRADFSGQWRPAGRPYLRLLPVFRRYRRWRPAGGLPRR